MSVGGRVHQESSMTQLGTISLVSDPYFVTVHNVLVLDIEDLIGYRFRWKRLVLMSMTDKESEETQGCIERCTLAFLGDALIDFLVLEKVCQRRPDSTSGTEFPIVNHIQRLSVR